MHFRYEYTIHEAYVFFEDEAGMEFDLGGKHAVRVRLRPPSQSERESGIFPTCAVAMATSSYEPNPRVVAAFQAISKGQPPFGTKDPEGSPWSDFELGNASPTNYVMPSSALPDYLQSFLEGTRTELFEAISRTYTSIRWRYGIWGPHQPFRFRLTQTGWSLDGEQWHPLPANVSALMPPRSQVLVDRETEAEIREVVQAERREPVGHVLFREAWSVRLGNERSALVIGIAALEAGFKECAAELTPTTAWLLENSPSPPVVRMLEEYLPLFDARLRLGEQVKPPPKTIITLLTKAVQIRNRIAHRGVDAPAGNALEEILMGIRDVLYLLDYYRGSAWALDHLRPETRAALTGVPAN